MRDRRGAGRRGGLTLRGTLLLGLVIVPVICGVTFFGLVLSTQAMFGAPQPRIDRALTALLIDSGWLPTVTPGPTPTQPRLAPLTPTPESASEAQAFSFDQPAAETSPPTPTHTPSPTTTPTATPSATYTPTATASPSPTPSPTPTHTQSPSSTPSRTPLPSPTASATTAPTHTPPPPTATPAPSQTPTNGPSPTPTDAQCSVSLNTTFESQLVALVNQERQRQGLEAYEVDTRLREAARVHATDMACNGFTGHTGSDGSSVGDRVLAQGYSWSWVGENYYVTGDTTDGPQIAFDWWMGSTPHRNNLLSPNYTQFGIGYVYSESSDYGGYFVAVFARPE